MELQTPAHLGPSSLSHPLDGEAAGARGCPRSSVVHFERELDFTLVILPVPYRSDFSEVSRVEEIKCPRGGYYAVTRKPRE
jgi:hypothetical protein